MSTPEPPSDEHHPPSYGYGVPPGFGGPVPLDGEDPESDPLVPPPYGGLAPWQQRISDTLHRSWRPLGLILLVTFAGPQVAFAVLMDGMDGVAVGSSGLPLPATAGDLADYSLPTIGMLLLVTAVTAFVNAIGWAAGIWAVTEHAAGLPVTVGAALQAGAARALPMFGWYVLYGLLVTVGLLMCLLPGIYLAVVGSLFSFVVVYERGGGNPIGRSFALAHKAFGAAAGRVSLLFGFLLVVACTVGACLGWLGIVSFDEQGAATGSQVTASVVEAAVSLPVNMVLLVGLLLTYTQLRARDEEISTVALWRAANQPGGPVPGVPG